MPTDRCHPQQFEMYEVLLCPQSDKYSILDVVLINKNAPVD